MNKATLKTLVVDAFPTCGPHRHTFSEDTMVANCLRQRNIIAYDTKDEAGGERYNPFAPGHHLMYRPPANPKDDWYSNYSINCKVSGGYRVFCNCLSSEKLTVYHFIHFLVGH